MAQKKVIAVVGATGAQGGGLVRAIVADPAAGFTARAITRDPDSDRARALADAGAELVTADLDDPASLERAFAGAHGAYCVTFFWGHHSPEREQAHARAMAQAAHRTGLAHVIWSTLEDTRCWLPLSDSRMPTLLGRYKVPHLDAKGEMDQVFRDLGVPTTFLLTSFYWDNLIYAGMAPTRDADGRLVFTLPMGAAKLPGIAAEDIGRCAFGIFRGGGRYIGRTVGIVGEHLSGAQMAEALSSVLGEEVRYVTIEPEAYRQLQFPGADDLGNMFQFKRDFNEAFCGARSPELSRELNPALQTFAQWLAQNRASIPVA